MPRQASRIPPTRRVPQGPRLGPQGPPPTPRARASSMLASGIRVVARVGVPQDHVRPFFDNPPGRAGPQDRGGDQTPLPWDGVSGTPLPWGTLGGPGGVPWGTLGGVPPYPGPGPPYPGLGTPLPWSGTPLPYPGYPPTLGTPWGVLGVPPYPGLGDPPTHDPWGGPLRKAKSVRTLRGSWDFAFRHASGGSLESGDLSRPATGTLWNCGRSVFALQTMIIS